MPMKPITVKANFQLDTSAARAQLQGLQRELSSVTKGATMDLGISSQITQAIKEAQQLKQILSEATDFSTGAFDLSKFDAAIKQQGKSIAEFKQSLQTLGPEGEKAFNSLATTIASAQVPLKRTSQGIQQMMTAFGNTMRWQATSMAMHKIVGTFQQAFNYAQNLDKSLTNIQIVTGHNADYMRNFAREANKAAQALSASTLEYTNASLIYYQQGLSDKEVTKRAETTLKLAKVTGESASKVSQQMTAVWNNFSNGVDNLERYADVMTALGATTASSSSEIAKGLEKFASVTKTIGLSYDYAASALATVTAQTRQSADSVGTAFKTLFSRLESLNLGETLDDSVTLNKYSEALLKVGVNVMDASGKLKNMDNILDELGGKWNNLNKAQQVALAQTVGGVRNYTSLITLMDNWDKFQTNLVTSQLAEGTLQHQADIYAQSWEAAQQRVKTASQGIYDTLISSNFFKGFNNAFAGVLNTINKAGQTLGSFGSTAGIMNLVLATNKDSIAKGIDNTIINTLGQTSFGQRIFKAQQQELLDEFTSDLLDTGSRGSQIRQRAYESLTDAWKNFNPRNTTKNDALTQQAILQQRTQQATALMNSTIDTEQLKVTDAMTQRIAAETFASKFGMGGGSTQAVQGLSQFIDIMGNDKTSGFKMGFSEYIQDTFIKNLTKLGGMNLDTTSAKAADALAAKIQAQADNALNGKDSKLASIIENDPALKAAFGEMAAGNFKNGGLTSILTSLSDYRVSQDQAYAQLRAELDQEFLRSAGGKAAREQETVTIGKGKKAQTITRDRVIGRDAQGRPIYAMDKGTEAAQNYLLQMENSEAAAKAAQKAGFINEQQLQDVLSGKKELRDIIAPEKQKYTSFGDAAVQSAQMVNSMAMAANSINNFKAQMDQGTATATGLLTTMGTTGMALTQMGKVLGDKTKILGSSLSVRGLGAISAGLAVAGAIGFEVYGRYKARTVESKSEYANENRIALNAQAKEDQQKYEQFLPAMQQQQQSLERVLNLQQGTKEYTAALIANNNAARELIETYGLQATKDYTVGSNGAISFSAEQIKQINEQLLETSERSNTLSQIGLSINSQLGYTISNNQLQKQEDFITTAAKSRGAAEEIEQINQTAGIQGSQFAGFSAQVHAMQTAEADYTEQDLEKLEKIDQRRTQLRENALGDYQTVLNSVIGSSSYEGDKDKAKLAAILLSLDSENLNAYSTRLEKEVFRFGQEGGTRTEKGAVISDIDSLSELYFETFGTIADANMSAQAMAAAIESQRAFEILEEQLNQFGTNLDSKYVSDFANINSKSYGAMLDLFTEVQNTLTGENLDVYNTFIQKALTDSVTAQDNLVQAMLNNSQFERQDFLKVASELQTEANLSTTQLENVTNYLNSFTNNFGETAGKAVFDALTNEGKSWNQNYYETLQKISLDNSISALADLTHFTGLGVNADLAEPLGNLRKAILEDIDNRGGLAKTLFTSSEFTKVFDSLSEQYKATGEITAQNIADLAKKNEIIGDYMTVTGSNEQAIADMMEMISSGNITAEGITPAIEHFVQRASGAAGAQQEALDVVAEQDLSDSITNMDKWAQNIGKAFYVGRTNDVLGDRPVLEGLKMILTPEDYAEYLRILNTGAYGGTTSSMLSDMKGSMANAYAMLSELEGTKKKKGKGGGGMDTVYEYLAKEGIFDENGIDLDKNTGKFTLGADFGEKFGEDKLVTFNSLKDYIIESLMGSKSFGGTYNFQGKGYSRSQAEDMATMMLGSMSASSMGTVLSQSGLIDAAQTFFGEISANGQKQGNYITNEQYDALFNQYSDVLALMKMEETKDESGKTTYTLREATQEELANKDYGVSIEQWRDYFTQEAKKVGAAIIGIKGQNLTNKDAKAIGTELAKASQGTLTANEKHETKAIVDAAVAAGVQTYRDIWTEYGSVPGQARAKEVPIEKQGQSLDYDQLQEFYNNVLGLSTETLNSHLNDISRQNGGLAFTHKYTDAYGVEHNINSRDYNSMPEFTRAIEQENEFSNIVLEYQRAQWVQQYFDTEKKAGRTGTYEGAMKFLREMTAQETAKAQAEAEKTTQSVPEGEKTTPSEGEETPTEGGEETSPTGEGTANITGTTGVITTPEGAYNAVDAEAQKAVGEYKNYTYQGGPESKDVYRYNLLHPKLTPLQAYNAVKYGNVDVDDEWQDKYGTTPEETAKQAQQEAEEAAASMAAEEDLAAAENETDAFISSMSEQEKAQYNAWVKAGGSGSQTEWNTLKQKAEAAAAEQATTTEPDSFISSMSEQEKAQYDAWVKAGGSGSQTEWNALKQRAETAAIEQATTNGALQQPVGQPNMDTRNELYSNYQQAFEAERAFLTENQDFLTNPDNAKLAAWTAAARENPELLGALYQNALNEGYSGDEFTKMYDYQGLQADTRKASEAYKPYAAATFNGSNVTAQQRFDFINAAYEKAQKDITSLTPFEKQVLTMIGEIDENTGTLVNYGEEEEDAATRAKNGNRINKETGEILDEEGNPIQFDQNGNPISSGSGNGTGGDNGGTTGGPGGGPGKPNANDVKAAGGAFVQGLLDGKFGDPTKETFTFGGHTYNIVRGEGGVITGYNDGSGAPDISVDEAAKNVDLGGAASGQNNARLLAYASGKEGHIAVTGELGPELRVKSDGSMDVLGKTGREYAWVEPDDKIYTASQSAGILKSNKIPGLEGLAKGINNFLPGYFKGGDAKNNPISSDEGSSGSGGGGGGGSRSRGGRSSSSSEEDPRYDPKTLKIRDVLERYYTILQQIDNITKAVERFSKVADRAWGRERIRAIEKQNEMQEKQYEAQKKYIAEIEDYLTTDQAALTTMIQEFVTEWNEAAEGKEDMEKLSWTGAEYDENGVLTNYREFVEKLVEQYNQKAASANQKDQYKFQEQLKDIQFYTETLNLYEEQKDALEDIKNAILDTAIKAISYEVEYKLELSGDADRILNFQADKYKDDVYQAAKYLEFLDQRADLTRQNLISVQDGIFKTLGTYAGEAMRTGAKHSLEELGIYGTDQFKLDEELTDVDEDETEEARIDRLKGISTKVNEWLEQLREKNADAAAEIDKMIEHSEEEGQEDIITNYEEVIRRLNQQIDYTMVRAKVDEWLEELRSKNAEAAAEIDKIVQRNADGEIINYTDVIERLNEENVRLSDEAIALLMEDQDAFFNWMSDFKDNPGWVDFTTEHKDLLTNYMDQIYQYLESLQDTYEQTIEQLGDSIKATSKQMDAAIDEFDYYGDVYKTFGNIVDLTNRHMTDVSKDFFDSLNSRVMDNSINKIKTTATNYHLLQKELEEVTRQYNEMQARADAATGEEQIYLQQSADKLKEQLDIANSQYEDAHKAFLSSWEDALSKMAENYKAAIEEASRNFEQGFSPLFNTLALLQAQFDREKALGDLYVDNYQRIHDLSKLNRDIESSILDTDNLKGKERLRDLQKEINDLQADGTELSEYDLDILDKKYKLELARQALEDAKDAKSLVRLARDNNGNWSYVYTANEDDVEKAEQDYEDAIREMEQANEDYIENIQDQIVQVQQEAQQAILALQPEDFATYDDYLAAVQAIQNSMYDTLNFLRSQMNNAFANNEYLDPYIINRYGLNDHDLTTDFEDTTLAKLLDSNNLDQSINHAKDNFENNLLRPALDAYLIYSQKQQEVYEAAEHDMATIGADFGQEMRYVAEMSDNEVQIVEKLSDRVQTAFEDMAAVVDEKTQKHLAEVDELVNKYEKLVEALTEVKRLSGENLPSDMMQAIDTVDTWREIEDLENKLKENGHIRLLEDLVDINREDVIYRSDKLADATEQIDKWLESLGDSAKDIAEAVKRDDTGQITNYKDIVQKLSNIEKNDDNKATLKEIKKWKEKDDKAVLMDENQALTEEGLWTYLMAGDEYTKKFLKDKIDKAAKNGAIDVGADVDETEKAKVENYLKAHGIVYVKWDGGLEKFESMDDWLAWYEKHKYVPPPPDDGGGNTPWTTGGWTNDQLKTFSGGYIDTGGYTGRWQSADTGMYTGEWPGGSIRRNGRLAWLHQKELILNAHDTENFLDAMEIVRQLDNLTNWMANGLGDLIMPKVTAESGELKQNVHIEAEFPNVTDHNEIEQAFNNLVNMASQYANRK